MSSILSWASLSLVFALLPAATGLLFPDGGALVTDVILLGLAAVFLHWSVTQPWNWYHSAQQIRLLQQPSSDDIDSHNDVAIGLDGEKKHQHFRPAHEPRLDLDSDPVSAFFPTSHADVMNQFPSGRTPMSPSPRHRAALAELYLHEILALISCFLLPLLAAYLLHAIRRQLSRPSEGLVSSYNLVIFLLASELRVLSHLLKLIQSRTLHLQRLVHVDPSPTIANTTSPSDATTLDEISARLSILEAAVTHSSPSLSQPRDEAVSRPTHAGSPDLDALNRAVRRYEKRASLLALQTDARFASLECRLDDAMSPAPGATTSAVSSTSRPNNPNLIIGLADALWRIVIFPITASWSVASFLLTAPLGLFRRRLHKDATLLVPSHNRNYAKATYLARKDAREFTRSRVPKHIS